MIKQDRRSLNLPTNVYEQLSYLQAEIRLLMKTQKIKSPLSKSAITNVLKALIVNAEADELVNLLK